MKITVYVPKKGNKWKVGYSGRARVYRQVDSLIKDFVKSVKKLRIKLTEKIILVVDYGDYHDEPRDVRINSSTQAKKEETIKDLIYFIADYLEPLSAKRYYRKYLHHKY